MWNWACAQWREHLELRDECVAQGHVAGMRQGCISSSAPSNSTITMELVGGKSATPENEIEVWVQENALEQFLEWIYSFLPSDLNHFFSCYLVWYGRD